jgi:hypothetical protein
MLIAGSASKRDGDSVGPVRGESVSSSRSETRKCPSAKGAVRFYARRIEQHRIRRGTGGDPERRVARVLNRPNSCPRYLAHVLQRRARVERLRTERWIEERTLRDFEHVEGSHAWFRAIEEAQRAYPGTRSWLRSCSASEGGWGRWVPNSEGSGVGGWLQFASGTFWRMFTAARADVVARGFRVPRSAASWDSTLGQALAGSWGVTHGRRGEWFGSGC